MTKPVCLVVGAGAGIGGNVAKRFAREGYHAVLARRSDKAGLDRLVDEIEASVARGGFGSPTFFVGDEMFFGKDRLREVEEEFASATRRKP